MRKVFYLLIVFLLFICATALADHEKTYVNGNYEYILLEDSTAEITKYNGKVTELTIPDAMEGYTVTRIGEYAFGEC